ncbi:hypothetical protein GCM10027596_10100 [Nocardioides korecus]
MDAATETARTLESPGTTRSRRPLGSLGRPTPASAGPVVLAALLGLVTMVALHDALVEDTYITLGYARGLFERGEWGLLPGVPSNTMTSPLNALLLGGLSYLTRDPIGALWVVAVVNPALCAWGLLRLGRSWGVGTRLAWLGVPLLFTDPFLMGTIGMETLLAVTVLVWLVVTAREGAPVRYGVLAGVAVLLRPDLVVPVAVVWLLTPAVRRPLLRSVLVTGVIAAVVCLPWFAWSWVHLGSAIPDTLAMKGGSRFARVSPFWSGLWNRFGRVYPDGVRPALWVLGAGLVAVLAAPLLGRWRRVPWLPPLTLAAAGLAYYLAFIALDVPPFFWYYGLTVASATITLAWALAVLAGSPSASRRVLGVVLAVAVAAVVAAPSAYFWGRSVARQGPVLSEGPVIGNWATTPQYRALGLDLARMPKVAIHSGGEFGEILYYCRCEFVDRFDSRFIVRQALERQRASSWLMGQNYRFYRPEDYRRIPTEYGLHYERRDPGPGVKTWKVHTPIRGTGYYALYHQGMPVSPQEWQRLTDR